MKVLIADKLPPFVAVQLEAMECEVDTRADATADTLPDLIGDAQVLVVRSTKVTAATLMAGKKLMLVIRAGSGTNTIDVMEASRRGVFVANCPGRNAAAVAELAMGLIVSIDRRIPDNVAALREHRWKKKEFGKSDGLLGKTIGVIGLGAVGRELLVRARAFGMRTLICERDASATADISPSSLRTIDQICAEADVISLHVPLTTETRGMIGRTQLAAMKRGTILINTARGGLIDREALLDAIKGKGLRVGLDVYDDEPAAGDDTIKDPIVDSPSVYGTHHIGASTQQAQDAVGADVVSIVGRFKLAGDVPNAVNMARETPATWQLVVRHVDRVGVLAGVLDALRRGDVNVQEVENSVFAGARAAICRLRLDTRPSDEVLGAIDELGDDIIGLQLVPLRP